MIAWPRLHAVLSLALLAICLAWPLACRPQPAAGDPAIAFTIVPEASAGGPERVAPVSGRVTGARPGQQIVLFARGGSLWWIQPLSTQPFTPIEADGTWKSEIHLGTEYAAVLAAPGYSPPSTLDTLPEPGGAVIAVATVQGTGSYAPAPTETLTFSGYEWEVRQVPSDRGGQNDYDPANAWTDDDGHLHLKLSQRDGRWASAEVALTRSLGYGTYIFTVRDVSALDPAVAFGMLTWDDHGADQNHRELDIEISQWGDRSIPNAQYVLQPYYVPANVARFAAPAGRLTHSFRWEPGRAYFRTVRGARVDATPAVADHEFTTGVPTPGTERVRINLYFFRFASSPPQQEAEVVIERFQYLP
jgi:hypothetical protein